MSSPIHELTGHTRALFSDVDGTLTTRGRIESATWAAIEKLADAGIEIVLVTGRPAGWGQALMSMSPATAVVAENGGVTFIRRDGKVEKDYGLAAATLPEWRRRMRAAAVDIMKDIPGARMSSDSKYREVDLAIDWNEEVSLAPEDAERVVEFLREAGFRAVRSSVHVNFGPPEFDKLSACLQVVERALGGDRGELDDYVFIGDALNDAPMFGGFPRSVGVANVREWWDELSARPQYVTDSPEGAGFRELAAHILALQGSG